MVSGLKACHAAGIAHRDMKAENILFDDQGNINIADFGFAGPTMGKDGTGYLKTYCGTEQYMAPEIMMKKPYKGTEVDIFATGVIMFMLVMANQPFGKAIPKDPYYKCVAVKKSEPFWKAHTKKTGDHYSDDFKDLFFNMCAQKTAERLTLEGIENHPFYTSEDCATAEEMLTDFQGRFQQIKAQREVEILEKHKNDTNKPNHGDGKAYRGAADEEDSQMAPSKALYTYDTSFVNLKHFSSSKGPDTIEKELISYFQNMEVEPLQHESKYKLNLEVPNKDQ